MSDSTGAEHLLFIDRSSKHAQFQDIIDEGLDGGYEDRLPALRELVTSGEPYHQLLACVMLCSWGDAEGFCRLIDWARAPELVPWHINPATYHRLYDTDNAFEMLADGVRTSFFVESDEQLDRIRIEAMGALLAIYHRYFFGQTLALALIKSRTTMEALFDQMFEAFDSCLKVLGEHVKSGFDLELQAACLLSPIACVDDSRATALAKQLLERTQDNKVVQEIIYALNDSNSPTTVAFLKHLSQNS